MRSRPIFLFLLAIMLAVPSASLAQSGNVLPKINVKDYKLKNGLTVLFHQDKSTPIVSVNVLYHVGSKNESPGRTGFAHLFEHMMFQGSKNYSSDYLGVVSKMGAAVNGNTTEDRTFYYETVPSNLLERALYLEADRMGYLLDALDQTKLDNQRDVVKNERRQSYDNRPYGTMGERIGELIYPEGHPYHHSVIGSMADLSAASVEDVKNFFRTYYVPNNAFLVLSGDFDDKQARKWIDKYFAPIKAGAAITRPDAPMPQLSGIIRKQYEDPFALLPRVALVWPGVRQYHADEATLDVLASILSSGRGSRLQSSLVYGKELAQQIFASDGTSEIGGQFEINALARPGKALDEVEQAINIEIERIKKDGVTPDEIGRAVSGREAQAIYRLQTVLNKGEQLAYYKTYLNRIDYFQADLDRYRKVTPDDVKRVANQYLGANHVVMNYVPSKTPPPSVQADKPTSTQAKKVNSGDLAKQEAMLPKAGPDPKFTLPAIEKTTLSNGLNLWVVQQHELPIVSMNLVVNAGGANETAEKSGVASMTAAMITQGTKGRSAVEISNSLQAIGAQVNGGASWDNTGVSMQTITKNLDAALDIYADVITNSTFPDQEFAQLKRRTLANFLQRKASATAVAGVVYDKVLYGDQPYGRQLTGDEKTVKAMDRRDLENFYKANYVPNNAALLVVGDVQSADIKARLERAFANWKPGTVTPVNLGSQRMAGKAAIYLVDKPGAAQSSVSIGEVGIERGNPDYFAVQVMNSILGGGGSGRLFMNLREDKGYTYGAYSRFTPRRAAGPFSASAEIQTMSTKEAIQEFIKELNGIRGARPVTPAELEDNKQAFIRRFPSGFETVGGISGQLANLVVYGLPDSYFNDYISKINAVTVDDVNRVANKYLDPSKMAIVIVGDRKTVEPTLKDLGYPIIILDTEGIPVSE